jgi:hypothetical protein
MGEAVFGVFLLRNPQDQTRMVQQLSTKEELFGHLTAE